MSTMALNTPATGVGLLVSRVRAVGTERVELRDAAGRVLAQSVASDRDNPAVDVSAMDGFAIRTADLAAGSLAVVGEVRIGAEPPRMQGMGAMRIVTGAPIPPGADAVMKREDVQEKGGQIFFSSEVPAGLNIRRQGENAPAGRTIVESGVEVTAPVAGALASFGVARPTVRKKVRVGVLVTGDEEVSQPR